MSLLIASVFLLAACGDELSEEEAKTLAGGGGVGTSSNPANVNFDDGTTNGWTTTGLWHVSTRRSLSAPNSLWYGQEGTGDYDTGGTNSGSVTNTVDLNGFTSMDFEYFLDNECLENFGFTPCTADALRPQISTNGGGSWSDLLLPPGDLPETTPPGVWVPGTIDLTAFTNSVVMIRFNFDTLDDILNNFEGAFLDNIVFQP